MKRLVASAIAFYLLLCGCSSGNTIGLNVEQKSRIIPAIAGAR